MHFRNIRFCLKCKQTVTMATGTLLNLYDDTSNKKSHDCTTFQYDFDDHIVLSVIFGVCFVVGLVLVFIGYRFFRTSLFIQSCFIIFTVTYISVINTLDLSAVLDSTIATAAGLVFGILGMFVTPVGLLFSSLIQSVFVTTCVLYAIHVFTVVESIYVTLSIAIATFIGFLIPVLKWQRAVSVMYICSFGTILIMLAVDYFCDLSMLRISAYQNALLFERSVQPCWFSWTLLGLWPLLLFCGCIVQFLKTAKEFDHTSDKYWYRRKSSEDAVRLLSNKSDIVARKWIDNTSSPTPSEMLIKHDASIIPVGDDEVFIKEGVTSL